MILFRELKVKRKSLAAEAAFIRREERAELRQARINKTIDLGLMEDEFLKKMKAYGFSEVQARRIYKSYRNSNWRTEWASHYDSYHRLHDHRVVQVREAARIAHVANAYILGQDYQMVEDRPKKRPCAVRLAREVNRFAPGEYDSDLEDNIREWMKLPG